MTNEERGKHMKRKKLVAILLTAAMTAGMLVGCGSQRRQHRRHIGQ